MLTDGKNWAVVPNVLTATECRAVTAHYLPRMASESVSYSAVAGDDGSEPELATTSSREIGTLPHDRTRDGVWIGRQVFNRMNGIAADPRLQMFHPGHAEPANLMENAPIILDYGPGKRFREHMDADSDSPGQMGWRWASVVCMLQPALRGGILQFEIGLPDAITELIGKPGNAIIFRPQLVHWVTTIEAGRRSTAVSFFIHENPQIAKAPPAAKPRLRLAATRMMQCQFHGGTRDHQETRVVQ